MPSKAHELKKIYQELFDYFGPQHWWPAETKFEVIIGAILTQSVSWTNVEKAIDNLKNLNLLSPEKILYAPLEIVERAVRPTRFYKQKAKRLREFCRLLVEEYQGDLGTLFALDLWELRTQLLAVKGIGPETADSIILYAASKPIFVVDAYTRRIFSRLDFLQKDASYQEMQRLFMSHLHPEPALYNEYHALIDALGKSFCLNTNPRCQLCPLLVRCQYNTIGYGL